METKTVTLEEEKSQMSHSVKMSAQKKKRTFTSSDEVSYSDFCPIIPADLMSIKEILGMGNVPRHSTWDILREAADEEYRRIKWTLFGNEAEKMELYVIRNQHLLRTRVDKMALRIQAEKKASEHLKYLERLRQKAPDFSIPLRSHTVWEGMMVVLTCTVQGCPTPKVTWYKDGVPLRMSQQPWNYMLQERFGLNSLEIRRCTPEDAGEYKVVAKSALGEATSFATVVVNSYQGAVSGSEQSQTSAWELEPDAWFGAAFQPSWVREGDSLTLQVTFTSPLLPFQQDVTWFRDGIQLHPSGTVDVKTTDHKASITLGAVYKEHEGVYTVQLRTHDGIKEHSAFVYVTDAAAAVLGGPASPLALQVCDVNKDYVFLSWQPPSADGGSPVEGYYVEKYDLSEGKWVRCNVHLQKTCHYPVFGLKEGSTYQFRVRAVNKAGAGCPSKVTEPVVTADPLEPTRTMVVTVDAGWTITITKDELEGEVKVPFPPTNVHACEVSDTYVVLSWTEPEPRGREPLTFYVERSLAGQNSWELASLDMVVGSPRFPVFNLVKDKQYCFRVRSVNKYGVSDPSEPSKPISFGKQQAVPAPPHSVTAMRDTDTSVLLEWQEPKDKEHILGYYIYYTEAGTQNWKTVNNKPVTKTRFIVHGLKTGRQYVFRVKSVSQAGNSMYSDESPPIRVKTAINVPSAPSAIALLLCTGSEMVLGWRAPARSGGSPVRGYYLDKREKGRDMWQEVNVKPVKERQFKVCNLTTGHFYQFRVCAANVAGVGKPSEASEAFLCEKWTMPEPGCPYDLEVRDVKEDSLVLLWAPPLYEGRGPVTGYLLEMSQGEQSDNWITINDNSVSDTQYKVSGLQEGQTYRFRVSAVNEAGTGWASLPSDPVIAQTTPDIKNIEIGVDEEGFIFLAYEANDKECTWSKNYTESIDASRAEAQSKNNRSVLTFTDPSEEDLGLYTVQMSDNPDESSSYDFTAEDLEHLKELSWQVRNPLIALKSGWQVEVSETGSVRLWLQTESLSNAAELRLIFNDQEISSTPHREINLDKARGLVEVLFHQLSREDEGSYTAQLRDGRAKNQFTLVLVDQKFREILALANANRRDHQRKKGPYFQDYLSWSVTEDCEVVMKCKVTNINKDSSLKWFNNGVEMKEVLYHASSGLSSFTITQVTQKQTGSYKAVVSDKRGEDISTLELVDEEFEKLQQQLSKQCGKSFTVGNQTVVQWFSTGPASGPTTTPQSLSAGPLSMECTADGFKLYCSLKYYITYLKTNWHLKEKRLDQGVRTRPGSSTNKVWLEILNPTESDKGKYTLEMYDGKETHTRCLDLSGQAFADALKEYQRLKQVAMAEKNRAHVTKGLPDVVAIMEGKSLCLTCFIEGDPAPEVCWLRNDKEIASQDQFVITKEPKCSTITITDVNPEDSGKYSIFVRNKYGSDTVDVTVSVYKHGEKPPENAVMMS